MAFDGLGSGIGCVLVGVEVISSSSLTMDCLCNLVFSSAVSAVSVIIVIIVAVGVS